MTAKENRGGKRGAGGKGGGARLASPTEQIEDQYSTGEQEALSWYTDSSYINSKLAFNGYDSLDKSERDKVKNMDSAIEKSGWNETETNTPFLRGAGGYAIGISEDMEFKSQQQMVDYINSKLVGTETQNVGYTSITRKPDIAKSFSSGEEHPIIMEYVHIEKGVKGAYLSGGGNKKAISSFGTYEDETLLQRNIWTAPTNAYIGNDGRVHVQVAIHN